MNMVRVGVFATERGWRLVAAGLKSEFVSRATALKAALRLVHLARWRGAEAQLFVQDGPGGELTVASGLRPAAAAERRRRTD